MKHVLETIYGLPLAANKGQVLASHKDDEHQLRKNIGEWIGAATPHVRRLGVYHSLRAGLPGAHATGVRQARVIAFTGRLKLLKRVAGKHGLKAKRQVARAGVIPALLYGCEVRHPGRTAVKQARATTLRVAGLGAAGVPADLSALALPRGRTRLCSLLRLPCCGGIGSTGSAHTRRRATRMFSVRASWRGSCVKPESRCLKALAGNITPRPWGY
jgi:hypothetical protein